MTAALAYDPPLIALHREPACYAPGERLTGEFKLAEGVAATCTAAELAVIWHTAGQGEEDTGIHYFDRMRVHPEFSEAHPFSCNLPQSPLSYAGQIVKVCWTVRVRLFFASGKEAVSEAPFRLGEVSPAEKWGELTAKDAK